MMDQDEMLAMEFAIGSVAESERQHLLTRFENDPEFQALVLRWTERLASVVQEAPQKVPSGVWSKIYAEIDASEAIPGSTTVRNNEGVWEQLGEGVSVKHLYIDKEDGWRSFLMRLEPGARRPAHQHLGQAEECLVLEGAFRIGSVNFQAGDYHMAPVDVAHDELVSEKGALLYLRCGLHVVG